MIVHAHGMCALNFELYASGWNLDDEGLGVRIMSTVFIPYITRESTASLPFFLDTTAVQTAQAVFFENNVFLTCSFADGSVPDGCVFKFRVNQNGTGDEEIQVLRSMGSQQCNVTANQLNGYMGIFAFDMGSGVVPIQVDTLMISTEAEFTNITGCIIPEGDFKAVTYMNI
jgi:hypothetical protein